MRRRTTRPARAGPTAPTGESPPRARSRPGAASPAATRPKSGRRARRRAALARRFRSAAVDGSWRGLGWSTRSQRRLSQWPRRDGRPVAQDVGPGEPAAGRAEERRHDRGGVRESEVPRVPVHRRVVGDHHVLVDRHVERDAGQLVAVRPQGVAEDLRGRSPFAQEGADVEPRPAAPRVTSPGGEDDHAAVADLPPGGEPAIAVLEVGLPAAVEGAAEPREPQRVAEPRPAVEERDAAHPVGMPVDDQQVERPVDSLQERQCDVVEVARAVERHRGPAAGDRPAEPVAEAGERPEAARQADPRAPVRASTQSTPEAGPGPPCAARLPSRSRTRTRVMTETTPRVDPMIPTPAAGAPAGPRRSRGRGVRPKRVRGRSPAPDTDESDDPRPPGTATAVPRRGNAPPDSLCRSAGLRP